MKEIIFLRNEINWDSINIQNIPKGNRIYGMLNKSSMNTTTKVDNIISNAITSVNEDKGAFVWEKISRLKR